MSTFEQYLRAAYPVLWVDTLEPHRAEADMIATAQKVHPEAIHYHWDLLRGLVPVGTSEGQQCSPVQAVTKAAATPDTVTFLANFHRFMQSVEVVQAIQNSIPLLKSNGSCLVIMAPDADKLPAELARFVVTLEFPLPDAGQIREVLDRVAVDAGVGIFEPEQLVDAAMGLTASEAEDAFALSFVEQRRLDHQVVAREKAGALLRQAKISLEHYPDTFGDLGGLDNLKEYTLRTARSPLSLGILLLGVPGAGKSSFAKALGNELGIPTLSLDFGRMLNSLVGSSEATIREALKAVDAMGRVVLFIDELEKGLAGAGSSGQLDSGVKAGVAGTFLKWLSDRPPGQAYVVATSNNIKDIPPEYLRSERWDSLWHIDLPTREEKNAIWEIHSQRFLNEPPTMRTPTDTDWTGAEIKACCRVAAMMDCSLAEASQYVVPVARSMEEQITAMRTWAKGRCLPASEPSRLEPETRRRLT